MIKLYRNARTAFMVKPIWTWIMHDLSEYINAKFPNEKFALMIDNASSHDLLEKLPFDNIQFINLPPNCTVGIQRSRGKSILSHMMMNFCLIAAFAMATMM